ncbi:MAG: ABC transporter ATP-binding protein [Sphaerochaetaceae bacterium]|nr:ABC transporter ATP-binding protein [Sphaerochaetaceae bacterium]MDD4220083.1 ABC transporter ATP-binding protein [Sphaerochaetaceae bacterium]
MSEQLLRFESVTKTYISGESRLVILEDLDLSVPSGTSVAITGKSGSGKSTLLNLAGGLDKPTAGSVLFLGRNVGKMHDKALSAFRNRHIGFVFQSHILLEDFNALENVCVPALIRGDGRQATIQRATQLLKRVGLADRLDHRPQKLSGGERQRVAICRALINQPDLIIADEPTGSLDEASASDIETLLLEMVKEEGRTLLLVTHNPLLAARCSSVYLLQNRQLQEGP